MTWADGILQAYYANLSTTGAFVETTNLIALDARIQLDFSVNVGGQQRGVRAESKVVRHFPPQDALAQGKPTGFGAHFEDLVVGESALFEFLADRLQKVHAPKADAVHGRKDARASVTFPTRWGTSPDLGRDGFLSNLSVSGAFLEARNPEPLGTHLYLWFELPSAGVIQSIKATAVVAFASKAGGDQASGMGIAFEVSAGEQDAIKLFVEAHLVEEE